jgi:DNA-binding MarR family transcriptional regulator
VTEEIDPAALDITTLASIGGEAALGLVRRRIAEAGHPAVRDAHGYVFQRLIGNEPTIGELAESLGMTQQGASKHVAELERLGYVDRVPDPSDSRIRRVRLSEQGKAVIAIARSVRSEIDDQLRIAVGAEALGTARKVLAELLGVVGRGEHVRTRSVPAPE